MPGASNLAILVFSKYTHSTDFLRTNVVTWPQLQKAYTCGNCSLILAGRGEEIFASKFNCACDKHVFKVKDHKFSAWPENLTSYERWEEKSDNKEDCPKIFEKSNFISSMQKQPSFFAPSKKDGCFRFRFRKIQFLLPKRVASGESLSKQSCVDFAILFYCRNFVSPVCSVGICPDKALFVSNVATAVNKKSNNIESHSLVG